MTAESVNGETILRKARAPFERSLLFRWLFDNHDRLLAAAGGRRLEWTVLCKDFAEEGLTDAMGKCPSPPTARMTWFRVRQEKKRIEELQRRELAEREARRVADPRRNMPSRFPKGDYGPPLAAHQPAPAPSRALLPVGPQMPVFGSETPIHGSEDEYWRDIVLPDCLKDTRIRDYDHKTILDLRQFFRNDGVPEPWDDPNLDPADRDAEIYRVIWSRAKDWARRLPYDRKNRSKW